MIERSWLLTETYNLKAAVSYYPHMLILAIALLLIGLPILLLGAWTLQFFTGRGYGLALTGLTLCMAGALLLNWI